MQSSLLSVHQIRGLIWHYRANGDAQALTDRDDAFQKYEQSVAKVTKPVELERLTVWLKIGAGPPTVAAANENAPPCKVVSQRSAKPLREATGGALRKPTPTEENWEEF